MSEATATTISFPEPHDLLTEVLRSGARELLAQAVEAEVAEWIDSHADVTDVAGRRQVVRNGYAPERSITTPPKPFPPKELSPASLQVRQESNGLAWTHSRSELKHLCELVRLS
ncbi:hypothetical protein [Botrimarina hoheduenensis]|uniref:Transposase, Mutator family n=1 Tax=Botrimarina hoheduenensis TaxID=2528000 RepID=A0A5C5WC44_9BACT|nr:hypothetical protein [Botrimarina hoheduenensis]TWT48478.1 hypothetical protein Pla111_02460 [Botrimarina hoheduenensis]